MLIQQEEDHRTHFCTFFMEYEDSQDIYNKFFVMKKDQEHEEHEEEEDDEEDEEDEDQEEEEEEEEAEEKEQKKK